MRDSDCRRCVSVLRLNTVSRVARSVRERPSRAVSAHVNLLIYRVVTVER